MYPIDYPIKIDWIVAFVASFSFIATLNWILKLAPGAVPQKEHRTAITLLVLWALVPPLWLWVEFSLLFREYGQYSQLETFKYSQERFEKTWLAALLLLIAIYFIRKRRG